MVLDDYLGRIVEVYSSGDFYEEAKRAKAEFFRVAGEVAQGSDQFETKMNNFLDWYLFERPLSNQEITPVKAFLLDFSAELSLGEKKVFEDLTESRNSVFELLRIKDQDLYVRDLFDKEKYVVEDYDLAGGFTKGDIFQGRLLRFQDRYVFNDAFVFHPKEAKKFIQKQIKKVRYLKEVHRLKLMHSLSAMKIKSEQYGHIDIKHIYSDEPIL